MRIKPTYEPVFGNQVSAVDSVRRRPAPSYSRRAHWTTWTDAGGWVWTYVWVRVTLLLIIFGTSAGLAFGPHLGVRYDMPMPKLTTSDIEHLRIGGAITDMTGAMLIDPGTDDVLFVRVDAYGVVSSSLRPATGGEKPLRKRAVLQASAGSPYRAVVAALGEVRASHPEFEIWISAPLEDETRNAPAP